MHPQAGRLDRLLAHLERPLAHVACLGAVDDTVVTRLRDATGERLVIVGDDEREIDRQVERLAGGGARVESLELGAGARLPFGDGELDLVYRENLAAASISELARVSTRYLLAGCPGGTRGVLAGLRTRRRRPSVRADAEALREALVALGFAPVADAPHPAGGGRRLLLHERATELRKHR